MLSASDLLEENMFSGSEACPSRVEADGSMEESIEKLARDNHKYVEFFNGTFCETTIPFWRALIFDGAVYMLLDLQVISASHMYISYLTVFV